MMHYLVVTFTDKGITSQKMRAILEEVGIEIVEVGQALRQVLVRTKTETKQECLVKLEALLRAGMIEPPLEALRKSTS